MKGTRLTPEQKRIACEMARLFPGQIRTFTVKMRFTRQFNAFFRRVEAAHRLTAKSKLVFKGAYREA